MPKYFSTTIIVAAIATATMPIICMDGQSITVKLELTTRQNSVSVNDSFSQAYQALDMHNGLVLGIPTATEITDQSFCVKRALFVNRGGKKWVNWVDCPPKEIMSTIPNMQYSPEFHYNLVKFPGVISGEFVQSLKNNNGKVTLSENHLDKSINIVVELASIDGVKFTLPASARIDQTRWIPYSHNKLFIQRKKLKKVAMPL